jgi:epoxide hydrolase 4
MHAPAPDLGAFSHQFFPINGLTMHVASIGADDAQKPAILFLHGFPDIWCGWARVMTALADRFACIAPDQRGYNQTSRPADMEAYRPEHLLGDIGALITCLSPNMPIVLAGHDWGGILAAWFCARHPERISKLILVNATHPALFQRTLWRDPVQRTASAYIHALRAGLVEEHWRAAGHEALAHARTAPAIAAGTMDEAEAALYREAWSSAEAWRAMVDWYRAAPFTVGEEQPMDSWPDAIPSPCPTPTLVIWGERDQVFTPQLRDGLADYFSDVHFKNLADIGHNPLRDAPAAVATAMLHFLSEHSE